MIVSPGPNIGGLVPLSHRDRRPDGYVRIASANYLVRESEMFVKDKTSDVASRVGGAERTVLYLGWLLFESNAL